mgnify:CR=1 FL=1
MKARKIKHGSHADHARMKNPYSKATKNAQDALRCKLDAWVRVIIDNPQTAKKGILEYVRGG